MGPNNQKVWGTTLSAMLGLAGCDAEDGSIETLIDQPTQLDGMDALASSARPVANIAGFDLGIVSSGGDIVLSWAPQGDAPDYTVWRSIDAHFSPGDAGAQALATTATTSFADPTAGDGVHRYYRVVAHPTAGDQVSTTVGKYAHLVYPGYNKIAQPLDTGVTDGESFALSHDPVYVRAAHILDGPSQGYLSWFPWGSWPSFTYGPGEAPIINSWWTIWGVVHEEVGHVPAPGEIQVPLSVGLNTVTVPLEFGNTMASDWLAVVPGAWRIGTWDAPGQFRQWHDGVLPDFAIEAGRHIYIDTVEASTWPPQLAADPDPDPPPPVAYDENTNPLSLMGTPQLVAGGLQFTESPVWLADDGILSFVDITGDTIHSFDPATGITSLDRAPTGIFSNGRALDPNGLMVECQHGPQQVVRIAADGTETVLADNWQGQPLNSPNDVVVAADGTIYFVDPTIGGWQQFGNVQNQPLGFRGLYRIDTAGQLHLEDDTLNLPTGIGMSPDGSTVYVGDNATGWLHAYAVAADGTLGPGAVISESAQGADGMCLDELGNIYESGEFGLRVFEPDGTLWGTYVIPQVPTANCAFGGDDLTTLYVMANSAVFAVDVVIPGAGPQGS